MAAGIALAAGPHTVMSASPVTHSVAEDPQLVRLGILPSVLTVDPLQRRERARGFEPGFCPEPLRKR
jgi:hypothetical protein